MNDKKPESLTGQISSPIKYEAKPVALPEDAVAEVEKIKKEMEEFRKKIVKKFPFTIFLSILPADSYKMFQEDEGMTPEEIAQKPLHVMLTIPEEEFQNIPKKIKPEILKIVKESKQKIWVHIKTPVDLWNYGLDSKYDFVDAIARSMPLQDKGLLGALRVASIHKTLVLRKFDKYVASYVIAGSLARGTADKDSDVDTFIVIDDTDVKRMSRIQLLERLRGMIYDYIREATALAGVKNILNVQVYLLTDFWQSVKDAVPTMFTFIRDGVPLYDRGTFLPWKLLLKMGKIKPSPEAVDMFMKSGDQTEALVGRRLIDSMVDIYWGVITPTQALMMLAGHAPPVPKTMVAEVKQVLVDKEKLMGMSELKVLEKVVKLYKDYEHGKLQTIPGKEIDTLLKESATYGKKMKELRTKIEQRMQEHMAEDINREVFKLLTNLFGSKSQEALIKDLDKEMIKKGKLSPRFLPIAKEVSTVKKNAKKINQSEMQRISRDAGDLINALVEFSQRKELVIAEKGIVHITYGDRKADVLLTEHGTFVVEFGGEIKKVEGNKLVSSSQQEIEKALKDKTMKSTLSSSVIQILRKELGEFEIVF